MVFYELIKMVLYKFVKMVLNKLIKMVSWSHKVVPWLAHKDCFLLSNYNDILAILDVFIFISN